MAESAKRRLSSCSGRRRKRYVSPAKAEALYDARPTISSGISRIICPSAESVSSRSYPGTNAVDGPIERVARRFPHRCGGSGRRADGGRKARPPTGPAIAVEGPGEPFQGARASAVDGHIDERERGRHRPDHPARAGRCHVQQLLGADLRRTHRHGSRHTRRSGDARREPAAPGVADSLPCLTAPKSTIYGATAEPASTRPAP